MNSREARYLLAIAEFKTLSKAAQNLYVSQPALTKFLKNEEQQVGAPLFSHYQNEYYPTYIGEKYLFYAKKVLELEAQWEAERSDLIGLKKGRLNLAVPIVRSRLLIPESIIRFHRDYPQVKVHVFEEAVAVERLLLQRSDIDLAIYNISSDVRDLDYEYIGISELVLVVPSGISKKLTPLTDRRFRYPWVDMRQLTGYPFILLDANQTNGRLIENLLADNNMLNQVWMRTRNSDVALDMARKQGGCTLVSEDYVRHLQESDDMSIYSVGPSPMQTKLIAAYRPGQYLPLYIKDYIEILKTMHRELCEM